MACSILITDDDPVLLGLYHRMFDKSQDLVVDYAATPQACYELLKLHCYDLALIDIALGDSEITGFDLLSSISHRFPETTVLMMSSMDSDAVVHRCRQLGAADFTSKNADFPRRLKAAVERFLDRRQEAQRALTLPAQQGTTPGKACTKRCHADQVSRF